MTEVAIPDTAPAPIVIAPASLLAAWVQDAREVNAIAAILAKSELVPTAYRGKPVDILACWLTGQEVGLAPMAALRSIDVIHGTPSLRAHAMRALVQSHGHKVRVVESTDTRCVMKGRRVDDDPDDWQEVEWDIDRAKRLGLVDKTGSQWKVQPKTMLIARATGEICRLIAADVLYAVPYATEELEGDDPRPAPAAKVTGADLLDDVPAKPRKAKAEPVEAPIAIVPADDAGEAWPEVAKVGDAP